MEKYKCSNKIHDREQKKQLPLHKNSNHKQHNKIKTNGEQSTKL
jgi:hypothetical protein